MLYIVNTQVSNLNVRSGPGEQYPIVGGLARGARVEVIGSQGAWKQLMGGGRWVDGDYLRTAEGQELTDEEEGLVLPHYRWPDDPNRKMLAGFRTGFADLKLRHKLWLWDYAGPKGRNGYWIFLRGYASHLGRDEQQNLNLSIRRARSVRDYLTSQCFVNPKQITGDKGIGERWSTGPETDDSAQWRAVEVVLGMGTIPPEFQNPRWESVPLGKVWLKFMYSITDEPGGRPEHTYASDVWKRVITWPGEAKVGAVATKEGRLTENVRRETGDFGMRFTTQMRVFADYYVCRYIYNPPPRAHVRYEFTLPETAEEVIQLYSGGFLEEPDWDQ